MVAKTKQTREKDAKKKRVKVGKLKLKDKTSEDLSVKSMKQLRGRTDGGTVSGFIPGAGVISAAISGAAKKPT